jgi:tetratricopeptide (TPR) repeat protein/mono/diheme cytochrome c family protein
MIGPLVGGLLAIVASQPAPPVTFAADVGPIIHSRCVNCHRPDGDAPFSLVTFDDVRRRASMIAAVTKRRYMPPWKPVPGFGDFHGSRRMTDSEIATIERWVESGMQEGTVQLKQDADSVASGFSRTVPDADLLIELPAYTLRAGGPDVFRNFVVPIHSGTARIVRALQFRPRNRAVHHANIRIDATTASRTLDEADPEPGYEGVIARSADFPDGQFLGWTPGQMAPVLSDDTSWRLAAGSDLVVQLHLRPTGAIERITPVIALYFGDRSPSRTPVMIRLGKQDLDIAAGAASHTVTDSFVLPVAVEALAIQAHAHFRARSVDTTASLPDGTHRPLLRIDDWDINWQDRYLYQRAVPLPAGTRITSTYVFDNSIANPHNPDRPPARSRWGWRSSDEMADVWIQVRTLSADDRARLQREITAKMLQEDAIGSEVLLEREPGHLHLQNDAARIYLALGQPARALAHFEAARQLDPTSPAAWFNEGTALEALARPTDAAAAYRQALQRNPSYSPALNNVGALLLRDGRLAEARAVFERAIAADSLNADAHANLGLSMIAAGEPDAGLTHTHRAIAIKPELLPGMTPHVLLLAAHSDAAMRRPREAQALAERIVRISEDQAAALDALAICQAALGEFDRAVQTAGAALSATPAPSPALREAILARIMLYRDRRPFVLAR